ncbi:MAG: hypothetical protein LAT63_09385 [Marinobacter sp.]|nr:hypothetical protein [Marinobacter sp.]
MPSSWLATQLRARADVYNRQFRIARHQTATVSAEDIACFVQQCLAPLFDGLTRAPQPWSDAELADLLDDCYRHGLALCRGRWLTPNTWPLLGQLFGRVLPQWLAPYPGQASTLLTRLLNTLLKLPGTNAWTPFLARWQMLMPKPPQVDDALLMLAWLGGLAEYRHAALQHYQRDPDCFETLLPFHPQRVGERWWSTQQGHWVQTPQRIGASVILGGDFTNPPTLFGDDRAPVIRSGDMVWHLYADAYGLRLLPIKPGAASTLVRATTGSGPLSDMKDLSGWSSTLALDDYDLFTTPQSYAVILIPRPESQHG